MFTNINRTKLFIILLPFIFLIGASCAQSSSSGAFPEPSPSTDPKDKIDNSKPIAIDKNATEIAQDIYRNPSNRNLIYNAVRESHFIVKNNKGEVILSGNQGLSINDWNIDIMRLALERGINIRLKDFVHMWQLSASGALGTLSSQKEDLDPILVQKFLADLQKTVQTPLDYNSPTYGIRKLAHIIVALGRENPETPYDLLNPNVSLDVPLNAVQFGLLAQRMSAELLILARKLVPGYQLLNRSQPMDILSNPLTVNFIASAPCQMTETEGLISDLVAAGSGMVTGSFFEYLVQAKFITKAGLEKFAAMTGAANIGLNYVKLAWSLAAFKGTIKAEKNPLERTKNRRAGQDTNLTAQFSMDSNQAQVINCFRPALNAVGLDFSIPQGGPLVGSLVQWSVATKVQSENDVVQTVGVDPLHQETDDTGSNSITVQGKPQAKDLSSAKIAEIHRIVPIIAAVNLKNKNPKQDAIDLLSGVAGLSALWSLPIEILNRVPLLFAAKINLKVRDWKEIEGDLFRVEAEYTRSDFRDRGVDSMVRNIADKVEFDFELKIDNKNKATSKVLTVKNSNTKYNSTFPSHFGGGEACPGTQSPIGEYDAFDLRQKPIVTAVYTPGRKFPPNVPLPPDVPRETPNKMDVRVNFAGPEHLRGWKFSVEERTCQVDDFPEEDRDQWVQAGFSFDNLGLDRIGKTIEINQRDSNGFGWLYKVTYVQ